VFGARNPAPAQMPSPSRSFAGSPGQGSQTSPRASPSVLLCDGFATLGQFSWSPILGGLNPVPAQYPSLSLSSCRSPGQGSQASPRASPSRLACDGLAIIGQLSQASPKPSPSKSA